MPILHWNPIRQVCDEKNRREYSDGPITFIPKNYVRQQKNWLYNNLFILLGGLWALTVSHDVDITNSDNRARLKRVFTATSLCVSHLLLVPLIIWKLHLHQSIVLGAIGMGIVPFLYCVRDRVFLSVVICFRAVFKALFEVGATVYIIRVARICSSIQGNTVFSELLTMYSLVMVTMCTANFASMGWQRYIRDYILSDIDRHCGPDYCPDGSFGKTRLTITLSTGQNIMFIAVDIVMALSGIILIAMYLKPIRSLASFNFSKEPQPSNLCRILKQFKKPKSVYLAVLIVTSIFMCTMTDEFISAYVTCHSSKEYMYFVICVKHLTVIFGVLTCVTVIDFIGCQWIYTLAICGQVISYFFLIFWNPIKYDMEMSHLVIFHVLCTSIGIQLSILQLLVIQSIIDDEVSAWCFFWVLSDIGYILRLVSDIYFCTGAKLWLLVALSPFVMIANSVYWYKFDENVTTFTLYGCCSQLIKTPKETLVKPSSFDLKIIIEDSTAIRKVETFLQRDYTLKSRYLVPQPDDVFSDS